MYCCGQEGKTVSAFLWIGTEGGITLLYELTKRELTKAKCTAAFQGYIRWRLCTAF